MKTLIVEDDFSSRVLLQEYLKNHGTHHLASNGKEALEAFQLSLDAGEPYDLICMDILMPEMDGQEALKKIRTLEKDSGIRSTDGVKIIMTTALKELSSVKKAYYELCDSYLVKPFRREQLEEELRKLNLLS